MHPSLNGKIIIIILSNSKYTLFHYIWIEIAVVLKNCTASAPYQDVLSCTGYLDFNLLGYV